ncbi:MAG: S8 family serine peptidase [Candidatus Jacksonbacteria bacterium]
MKNFKKSFSSLLILSILLANTTLFSAPVLAYEKADLFSKQIKNGSLHKIPESNPLTEDFLIEKGVNKKPETSKEYEKINNLKEFKQDKKEKQNYVEGEILVKYKNNKINLQTTKGKVSALNFIRAKSLEKKEDLRKINTSVLKIKDGKTVEQKIAELKNDPNVEYVQPNFQYYPLSIDANDTYKNLLWGLDNTGQAVNTVTGAPDADIDAPEAWAINEGTNASAVVAVIDTGVAYNHPDLIDNMWDGASCIDENGAVLGGCNHGYDYEDNDKIPLPTRLDYFYSHGTHIAGTIAAVKNNNKGIIGVAPNAKIMALKSSLTSADNVKSINFAKQNGAKIINASWGGGSDNCDDTFDQALYEAIQNFAGLFIAAAGNDSFEHDGLTYFDSPSDYGHTTSCWTGLNNLISVAAIDQDDNLADFSDYGAAFVDVGAPGTNIYSTIADSNLLSETFEEVTPPNIPSGWTKTGEWGTNELDSGIFWGKVLYGDLNYPYLANADTMITSPFYNLNQAIEPTINFWTRCDTSYHLYSEGSIFQDYMALEVSMDGIDFFELKKWNEFSIDIENESGEDSTGPAIQYYSLSIPDDYLTSNFKFRLRWITDEVDNNYDGCLVDDINITKYSDGSDELYDYYQGTSMAAPHVAGLAALVWGYKPELSYVEVKNTILTTGDNLPSLAGKTVTGKRINAFNALDSLTQATHTISGTIKYYDGIKTVPNAAVILENDIGTQLAATTTDSNGFYQFTDVAGGGNYVVRVEKDDNDPVNGVNGLDLTKIVRHIVSLEILDNIYKIIAADVNEDNIIVGTDLTKIVRYIVGIDDALLSGDWKFYDSDAIVNEENYLTVELNKVYTNLIADMSNQDFVGIKMGDVNNSWINN